MIVWLIGGVMEYYCKYLFFIFIIRYEMLSALPPFYHENIDKMYYMIKNSDLKFSKRVTISNEAKDLLSRVRNIL